jgi:peroxiredoxin
MQRALATLEAAGIRTVAISADPPDISREHAQKSGYTFTLLSDENMETIHRYDVFDPEQNVARPAEFLLDATGTVRWRLLTGGYYVRARPEQVLEAARSLP